MNGALTAGSAFMAVLRRDMHVYLSYRTRMVSQVLTMLFSLTLFYYISQLVHVSGFTSRGSYFGFVVVGISLVSILYSSFAIPELVRQELVAGTFDRLLLSPFGAIRAVIAMSLFPMIVSYVLATLTLVLGCVIFGLKLHWSTVPLAIPATFLVLLAFLPFGILFAALTIVIKQGTVGTSWVIALLSIIGGLYFPVSLLPEWVQTASKLQPFTPGTDLLRHLLVGTSVGEPAHTALLKVVGFAIVLIPMSIFALARAIRSGQRRGTIIEY